MRSVDGMSVLVTGGGSGIGEATARLFGSLGARVTVSGRRPDRIEAVAREIGPSARGVAADVTVEHDRRAMLDAAIEHGGGRLDAVVHSAANMYRQAVGGYTESVLREAFETNVISAMMLSSLAVEALAKTEGAIVFLGSIHTRRAYPGATPYATTKAAVEGLARVMAAELGRRKIRVTCVLPGAVHTELNVRAGLFKPEQAAERYAAIAPDHALGRIGAATEVAESIVHLVRAEWVTGVALEVDGGLGLGVSNF
jgi:NAD(P)-dependent dehydrogenase (short-subunit alcohol dehydrogenase family)